ncbi:hypothetical protein S40285_10626 [Stachybotrys chlorohalonatus IBT 40285]|uniref:Uncharacterized protein n=1 Tax=Stachybotrys chlorohalonatus (strain IBT 40285) TaxID=1283841 RepID=A0A084QQF3_STAC4|nr:hypothetical protein S40285_10626 [Stachybotrys chlorohalonata IBT 40285]
MHVAKRSLLSTFGSIPTVEREHSIMFRNTMEQDYEPLSWLKELPCLDVTTLTNLPREKKIPLLNVFATIRQHFIQDLGAQWKAQPEDDRLCQETVEWIHNEVEPALGPVNKWFLLSTDLGVSFTERIFEGFNHETKFRIAKFVIVAIYLKDLIETHADVAAEAETFLIESMLRSQLDLPPMELYKKVSVELACHVSDPVVGNLLLQVCVTFVEDCVLQRRNDQDQTTPFLVQDTSHSLANDSARNSLVGCGFIVPRLVDADYTVKGGDSALLSYALPGWLRGKSVLGVGFCITTFGTPGEFDLPTMLWMDALPDMQTYLEHVNDLMSLCTELAVHDCTSNIAIMTKERRQHDTPGTAPDGGWCLRDTLNEVHSKILDAKIRVDKTFRPNPDAWYNDDGIVRNLAQLVALCKGGAPTDLSQDDVRGALTKAVWERHLKAYVAWHDSTPSHRKFKISDQFTSKAAESFEGWTSG